MRGFLGGMLAIAAIHLAIDAVLLTGNWHVAIVLVACIAGGLSAVILIDAS